MRRRGTGFHEHNVRHGSTAAARARPEQSRSIYLRTDGLIGVGRKPVHLLSISGLERNRPTKVRGVIGLPTGRITADTIEMIDRPTKGKAK
jgi:hypothetical protein